jgi:hypothetical protein
VADPADPTWYIELRGRVGALASDPDLRLERAVAEKYVGRHEDVEPSGTQRFAASLVVGRVTSQHGH